MSYTDAMFDRVSGILKDIKMQKEASEKQAMKDPGGYDGPSSHPSSKPDENEIEGAPEGAQSADNTKVIKESIPDSVDEKPDATPENAPKVDDTQQGQGVDKAKLTGEDPSTEDDYKGKPTGDKEEGGQGGTAFVADGQYGDKYAALSDDELLKRAAALGNEVAAELANGTLNTEPSQESQPVETGDTKEAAETVAVKEAAEAGATLAKTAGEMTPDDLAAAVIEYQIKVAQHQADLAANHMLWEIGALQKKAEELTDESDPTGGESEGEDYGSEEVPAEAPAIDAGGEAPLGDDGAGDLLAAMGGGGAPPMEEAPEAGLGAVEGLGADEGIQQLAMALLELGIDPAELAAVVGAEEGTKMASLVQEHKTAGKFRVEAPQTPQQKQARDCIRNYLCELRKKNG